MIHQIYICSIIVITVIIIVYYYAKEAEHKKEIEKINQLEAQKKLQQMQLNLLKSKTKPCEIGNFVSPRSCYVDSGYKCTWNDEINRCDAK